MDKLNIIKEMLIIYGSTTIASLDFNKLYYIDEYKKAYENSKRKIVYRDLTMINKRDIDRLKEEIKTKKKISIFLSILPIFQVFYTVSAIYTDKRIYSGYFDERMEQINENEKTARTRFLKEIKQSKIIPEDIKEKLKDKDYLPGEAEFYIVRHENEKERKRREGKKLVLDPTIHKKVEDKE